jgi:hypothetical protein
MERQVSRWERVKVYRPSKTLWFWSCVGCVAVTLAAGFSWGGWVTAGGAARMTQEAAQHARADLAATYCVSKFESAPDAATKLAALKKTDIWDRDDLIVKGGWTMLPGTKQVVDGAADLCVQRLMNASLPTAKSGTAPG